MSVPHSGFVAVVGRPNVGKSTLINRLVGQKISITTPRPQTTRHRILGIARHGDDEIVLIDTPGIHQLRRSALNRAMNRAAMQALDESDVVVWITEAGRFGDDDARVLEAVERVAKPVIAVLNKIDRLHPKERLLEALAELSAKGDFAEIVPVSAQRGDNLERLVECIVRYLPVSEAHYPDDAVTDRSVRFLVAEIIREKLMLRLSQELPYGLTVVIEAFDEQSDPIAISAAIIVERPGPKPIVIGKGGRMLKAVGTAARRETERLLGQRVRLELWVRVRENWSDSEAELRSLGLD